MLLWLTAFYPIKQTYETLKNIEQEKEIKNPRKLNEDLLHWCTFWLIYTFVLQYDWILSYIPFWSSVLGPLLVITAYTPVYNKMIYDCTVKGIQYKMLVLNKTLDLQKHLDFVAQKYLVPGIDFLKENLASKLPTPLSDYLIKFINIVNTLLIHQEKKIGLGPYKVTEAMKAMEAREAMEVREIEITKTE